MCILYWEEKVSGKGHARFGILAVQKVLSRSRGLPHLFVAGKLQGVSKEPITDILYGHMKAHSQSDSCSSVT